MYAYLSNNLECTSFLFEFNVGNALNTARLLNIGTMRAYRQTHEILHHGELLRITEQTHIHTHIHIPLLSVDYSCTHKWLDSELGEKHK